MTRSLRVLITTALLFLFLLPKTSLAQGTYWCAQPETGKCMLVNSCEEGYKPANPNKCNNLIGPDIGYCFPEDSEEDCVPTSAPVGLRCNPSLKICEKGCEYGIDPGCLYQEGEEATCNTNCQLGSTPLDWACNEETCECEQVEPGTGIALNMCLYSCCTKVPDESVIECVTKSGTTGLNTAIGCIPIRVNTEFLGFLLVWSMSVAGGIATLLIIYTAFILITSSGDKNKIQTGKQILTSAVAGLLFLIFSVFMLRVIGIDILGIIQLAS